MDGVEKELEEGAQFDETEIRTAVIQHHDLVDHGQFQMGGRIIHRYAGIFRQQDDEKGEDHEQQGAPAVCQKPGGLPPEK
jgi:hypothetical protein